MFCHEEQQFETGEDLFNILPYVRPDYDSCSNKNSSLAGYDSSVMSAVGSRCNMLSSLHRVPQHLSSHQTYLLIQGLTEDSVPQAQADPCTVRKPQQHYEQQGLRQNLSSLSHPAFPSSAIMHTSLPTNVYVGASTFQSMHIIKTYLSCTHV